MGKYNRVFGADEQYGYSRNPYYNPERCGLKLIGVAEKEPDYDFYMLIAVEDVATGAIFVAFDSGCSCPCPFEDYRSLADMTRVKKIEDYDKFADPYVDRGGSAYSYGVAKSDIQALRRKVKRRLDTLSKKSLV